MSEENNQKEKVPDVISGMAYESKEILTNTVNENNPENIIISDPKSDVTMSPKEHNESDDQKEDSAYKHKPKFDLFVFSAHFVIVKRGILFLADLSEKIEEGADSVHDHIERSFVARKHEQSRARYNDADNKKCIAKNVKYFHRFGLCENFLRPEYAKYSNKADKQCYQIFFS